MFIACADFGLSWKIVKDNDTYTTLTDFSMKYLMMCKDYTDVGGIK